MRILAPIAQHLAFYHAWRPGHVTDRPFASTYLEQTTDVAGLEMVREPGIQNPVVSSAHQYGLGALAHITTSCVDWMTWDVEILDRLTAIIGGRLVELDQAAYGVDLDPGPWAYLTVLWYTCGGEPVWDDLAGHADEYFGTTVRAWERMLPELSDPAGMVARQASVLRPWTTPLQNGTL